MSPLSARRTNAQATRRRDDRRSGAAAVEFAICLPLMLLITFGAVEAANGIYLKQILTQAAYETARIISNSGGTESAGMAQGQQILDARQIQDGSIEVEPAIAADTEPGTEIVVTVSAPSNSNAFAPLWFFRDANVAARVVMTRN
jgi:Flp pilus assembly protein TadG